MRVVFLDKDSLPVRFAPPRCADPYVEYPHTAPQDVVARLAGASVAIINKVTLEAATLAQLPGLRLVALAATGHDCIDVGYCRAHGIAVSNVRDYAVHSVSEHVFTLLLALRRNLARYAALVADGDWQRSDQFCAYDAPLEDLHGSVMGIVGMGSIGRATAALAAGFGMRVLRAASPSQPAGSAGRITLRELLAAADVVTLHCPLAAATRGLLGAPEIAAMKRNAILINTARGGLVDESALAAALRAGAIAGAGFDVLSAEPPAPDNPLLQLRLPNFVLTPHVAWASAGAMRTLAEELRINVESWAQGRPRNLVA